MNGDNHLLTGLCVPPFLVTAGLGREVEAMPLQNCEYPICCESRRSALTQSRPQAIWHPVGDPE